MKTSACRWVRFALDRQTLPSPARGLLFFILVSCALGAATSTDGAANPEAIKPARVVGVWRSGDREGLRSFEGSANAVGFELEIFREAAAAGGLAVVPDEGEGEPVYLGCAGSSVGGADLDLCVPHRSLQFHILKRERSLAQSLPDLRRKEIVVVEGSEVIPFLTKLGFGDRLLRVATVQGAASLLAAGKREVAIVERFALYAESTEEDFEGLLLLPEPVHTVGCGLAVNAGNEPLRLALEKGVETIRRDGRYERIASEHCVHRESGEARGFAATLRRHVGWLLIPLSLLLLASCVVALALRQRAMEKILSLQEQVMEEKIRLARVRDDAAKQRFVLNQLSTVSLVDQLLESSGSRSQKTTTG